MILFWPQTWSIKTRGGTIQWYNSLTSTATSIPGFWLVSRLEHCKTKFVTAGSTMLCVTRNQRRIRFDFWLHLMGASLKGRVLNKVLGNPSVISRCTMWSSVYCTRSKNPLLQSQLVHSRLVRICTDVWYYPLFWRTSSLTTPLDNFESLLMQTANDVQMIWAIWYGVFTRGIKP